jgi:hypothetical protein
VGGIGDEVNRGESENSVHDEKEERKGRERREEKRWMVKGKRRNHT